MVIAVDGRVARLQGSSVGRWGNGKWKDGISGRWKDLILFFHYSIKSVKNDQLLKTKKHVASN
ncbi:MAG: hypothetical protein WCX31_00950 [Salinivirgaceae bacterium]|jgi:hypothetical protein